MTSLTVEVPDLSPIVWVPGSPHVFPFADTPQQKVARGWRAYVSLPFQVTLHHRREGEELQTPISQLVSQLAFFLLLN